MEEGFDISSVPEELLSAPSSESPSVSLEDMTLNSDSEPAHSPRPSPPAAQEAPKPSLATNKPTSASNSPIPKRRLLNFSVVPVSSPSQTTPKRLNQPAMGRSSPALPNLSPPKERSPSNSSNESSVTGEPATDRAVMVAAREQDFVLSKYLSDLAAKESHVSELKLKVSELKAAVREAEREARAAEADLTKYKQSGNSLMNQLHSHSPSLKHHSVAELSEAALHRNLSRSPSPQRRSNGQKASFTSPGPAPVKRENEMLEMGKRVVDEINHQFWSFVEDVKSATIGPEEDYYEHEPTRQRSAGEPTDRGRQPAPRLKAKQSFSNMVDNIRRLSPERKPPRSDPGVTHRPVRSEPRRQRS